MVFSRNFSPILDAPPSFAGRRSLWKHLWTLGYKIVEKVSVPAKSNLDSKMFTSYPYHSGYSGYPSSYSYGAPRHYYEPQPSPYASALADQQRRAQLQAHLQAQQREREREAERQRMRRARAYFPDEYAYYDDEDGGEEEQQMYDYGLGHGFGPDPFQRRALEEQRRKQQEALAAKKREEEEIIRARQRRDNVS